MKSKILFQLVLFVGLGVVFFTMKSDSNGKYNNGTSCGNCHGNLNAATTVVITGLPSTYTPGQTYNLGVAITNATNTKAGFNLLVSGGTLNAGTGSKVNGAKTQITHTAPMNATGTTTTFNFTWTAPTTIMPVNFSAVGNAVNGDNSDSQADQWNTTTNTISGAWPASVNDINTSAITCYPNPATSQIILDGVHATDQIVVYSLFGQKVNTTCTYNASKCSIDIAALATGTYYVHGVVNGKHVQTSFIKN